MFSFTTPDKRNNETQTGKNASGAHFDAPKPILFHLTNPPLQKFVQQHSEEFGDGFSIEIYGTLDAETKKKFDATGFAIKYFDTKLGYSRVNDAKCAVM